MCECEYVSVSECECVCEVVSAQQLAGELVFADNKVCMYVRMNYNRVRERVERMTVIHT